MGVISWELVAEHQRTISQFQESPGTYLKQVETILIKKKITQSSIKNVDLPRKAAVE